MARTTQILEAMEMKMLRRILNKIRIDKIRNKRIREICEIQNITSWVQRRRTEWSMHISRMMEDQIVRRIHGRIPLGKRNRGRPVKKMERHTGVNRSSAEEEGEEDNDDDDDDNNNNNNNKTTTTTTTTTCIHT
jgi:hypothetical protein